MKLKQLLFIALYGLVLPLLAQNLTELKSYENLARKFEQEGNLHTASHYLNKIAFAYWEVGKYKESVAYFEKSLVLAQKTKNYFAISQIHEDLSSLYELGKQYPKALAYLNDNVRIFQKIKDKKHLAETYLKIATLHSQLYSHQTAIQKLDSALLILQELEDKQMLKKAYELLANAHQKAGNPDKADEFRSKESEINVAPASPLSSFVKAKLDEIELWLRLMEEEKQKQEKALHEQNMLLQQKANEFKKVEQDIMRLRQEKEEIERIKKQQASQIEVLNVQQSLKELEIQKQKIDIEKQNLFNKSITGGSAFLLLLLAVLYMAFQQKRKANEKLALQNAEILAQKEQISQQNEAIQRKTAALENAFIEIHNQNYKITSSINYAKRIQDAMLPIEGTFYKALPESFILFQPRDIVSGDFYWLVERDYKPLFEKKDTKMGKISILKGFHSEKVLITAVDCTGHGVPGAFMSVIGMNLLNEIINMQNIIEVDQILYHLHKAIRKVLKQEDNDNRDGMDMAICLVDKKEQRIDYAGAKNPLVYFQDGQIHLLKGDKFPIGGFQKEESRRFSKHSISTKNKSTMVYMFSDGYQDQFGGKEDKKFGFKRLRETLDQVKDLDMETQKQELHRIITEWRGEKEQIDDILVIGFRV